ncbi:hypothetical protein RhiJN_15803 [Ceratobasidium sp. AG-Ba]|nr:hypothetical protein RhiJN_15803 [Ceratobasidium sp. AG-Ba]
MAVAQKAAKDSTVAGEYYDWGSFQKSISRRQVPVVVAPPTVPRPITYTPLAPQATSSLDYWWPYGSNGVNPTATPVSASATDSTPNSDTSDRSTPETTNTDVMTSQYSSSSSSDSSTLTNIGTFKSQIPPLISPPAPGPQRFEIVSLVPLFIILGVITLATLIGWTYGRCARLYSRHKELANRGSSVGGVQHEVEYYDPDIIKPLHSMDMDWVNASRIYDHGVTSEAIYNATRAWPQCDEPGTPSKHKNRSSGTGWFRHTFSRKRRPDLSSPSGEKGLSRPTMSSTQPFGPFPPIVYDRRVSQRINTSHSPIGSPKIVHDVTNSPTSLDAGLYSSLATSQRTTWVSASRHKALRCGLLDRAQADDREHLLGGSRLSGGSTKSEKSRGNNEDETGFNANSPKRLPDRRFYSSNNSNIPRSPARSPDPQQHRARMRRLRSAVQAGAVDTVRPTSPNAPYSLSPRSSAALSPPLCANLFFEGSSSKQLVTCGAQGCSNELRIGTADDPFGPRISPSPGPVQRTERGRRSFKKRWGSTEAVPLSPELRDAAMTRFEDIVKTSWSTRNLAETPQSPTMFGALSPTDQGPYERENKHQTRSETTLLAVTE